jgi:general stress protein 26
MQMNSDEFWTRIATINAGMLETTEGERWVPMSHHAEPETNTLWFITAQGTDVVDAVQSGSRSCGYMLADNDKGVFAQLRGQLTLSTDREKLEELWSPVSDAWFDDGIDDPDVRLLSFRIDGGEVWLTPASGICFLFGIAKAQLTGDTPDMGEHFTL